MFSILKWLLIAVVVLAVAGVIAGQLGLLRGSPPADLGVREGKLKRPSKTPNSVSSQADLWPGDAQQDYARIAPLALVGSGAETMARLKTVVQAQPGAEVVKAEGDYLYAIFTTRLMKYTDDVEFWFDPAQQVVQVRSASRLGRKDLGANRARVEAVRAALQAR
jgi:uncharacterized protein (DUF1499 family)